MSEEHQPRYSAAWEQFLVGRRLMLAEYEQAKVHAHNLPVQTHHGLVAEAAFRGWLESFLPKRFGVTSGYIRGQQLRTPWDYAHFDVIIFDQLNSPILWIDTSRDKSEAGRSRIIPAEYVHAVLEVKSTFSLSTVRDAADKLRQLDPLMRKLDLPGERYPTYLCQNVVLAQVFFELRSEAAQDVRPLEVIRDLVALPRAFYGAVILRAENRHPDDTGLIRLLVSKEDMSLSSPPGGLLAPFQVSASRQLGTEHFQSNLTWGDINFSRFAFDLLAIMNGTYRPGFASSFHDIDFAKFPDAPDDVAD
jgi:hypothetical protein